MPKFVMLSTLGPDGSARLTDRPERLLEVRAEVEAMGVRVLEQYALLGQWDFLNILEAPDEIVMAKVATTLAARGTLKTMTLPAIDVEQLIEALHTTPPNHNNGSAG
jgi:uncharacterized protein with GYD domain